jgi:hypothetical protein
VGLGTGSVCNYLNLNNASAASIFFLSFFSCFSVCWWRALTLAIDFLALAIEFLTTSAIFCFYSAAFCFGDFAGIFTAVNGKSPLRSSLDASFDGCKGSLDNLIALLPLIKVGLISPKAA